MKLEDFPVRSQIKSDKDFIYDITYPEKLKLRETYTESINTLMVELKEYERNSKWLSLHKKEVFREGIRTKIKEEKNKFEIEFRQRFPYPEEIKNHIPSKLFLDLSFNSKN